jgi:predicted phosphodiesterase
MEAKATLFVMKLAVVSDIHGNLHALEAVLAEIDREGVDAIVNAGDTLSGPLLSVETAELLEARGVPMIAGNHERQVLEQPIERMGASDACTARLIGARHREWLASAPKTRWVGDEIFVCHGTPDSDLEYLLETVTDDFGQRGSPGIRAAAVAEIVQRLGRGEHTRRAQVIVCGHSHVPRVVSAPSPDDDGHAILIVNPGSVGLPGYDDDHPHAHIVEAGSPHARYALVENTRGGWCAQLRCVAYDYESMARLADHRNRPDWAQPLRTGRMR